MSIKKCNLNNIYSFAGKPTDLVKWEQPLLPENVCINRLHCAIKGKLRLLFMGQGEDRVRDKMLTGTFSFRTVPGGGFLIVTSWFYQCSRQFEETVSCRRPQLCSLPLPLKPTTMHNCRKERWAVDQWKFKTPPFPPHHGRVGLIGVWSELVFGGLTVVAWAFVKMERDERWIDLGGQERLACTLVWLAAV